MDVCYTLHHVMSGCQTSYILVHFSVTTGMLITELLEQYPPPVDVLGTITEISSDE